MVPVDQYKISEDPQVTLVWRAGQFQPEIMQFILGRIFAPATGQSITYIDDLEVDSTLATPAITSAALLGSGVGSDTGQAAIKSNFGVTQTLTRLSFDPTGFGTASTVTNSFMLGTGLSFRFSPDLEGKTVVYQVQQLYDTLKMQDAAVDFYKVSGLLINTTNQIWRMEGFRAKPILDGSQLDVSQEEVAVAFRLFTPADKCSAYDLQYLNVGVAC